MSGAVQRVLMREIARREAVATADAERARELDQEAAELRERVTVDLQSVQEMRAALMALMALD